MNQIIIPSRRSFLKSAAAVSAVSSIAAPGIILGNPDSRKLKIGLVGCGGRGSGAAGDAMTADSNAELWAAGDVFPSSIEGSLSALRNQFKDRVNVEDSRKFTGMDAYQKVLESGVDVVILATPPGFRPIHFEAAVNAGKHIFCEKPVAVDMAGVKKVMAAAQKAKEKGLAVVSGFCWRKDTSRREFFKRIHSGDIGDIAHYYATYYTGPVKSMARKEDRKPEWSDVEWQVRNWYNFSWLGGDGLVEQAVHSVDKVGWAFLDQNPIACHGNGGRQVPFEGAEGYNIFDHFSVIYEYPNGVLASVCSRQTPNCENENADYILGTKGKATIKGGLRITGDKAWRDRGEAPVNMYVYEHMELFQSIREGKPLFEGDWMCHSTALAIMGRNAAYTGKRITWDQLMKSEEDLAPDDLKWDSAFTPSPMPRPGITKFV